MFLWNLFIFINKPAMRQQKFTVQVTTLPDYDDITWFDVSLSKFICLMVPLEALMSGL